MSDFFKKFKNVFVVDENKDNKTKQTPMDKLVDKNSQKKAIKSNQSVKSRSTPKTDTPISLEEDIAIDPKFTVILLKSLEKNDQEGYDYLEFKSTLKSLSSMQMDEKTRFKSAEAMAKAMGVEVDNIIKSAEFYLQVLEKEENLFEEALKKQHKEKVLGKEDGIVQLTKKMKKAKSDIVSLEKEIDRIHKAIDKSQTELNTSLIKMNKTKASFTKTYNNMTSQIIEDKDKIVKYLK